MPHPAFQSPPRYCPLCATPLQSREAGGMRRPACPACDFVHYDDPKLAVGALIEDEVGRLLYTQRDHEPAMGAWAWPSGYVDRGEELRAAAAREVREETGVEAAIDELLGAYSRAGDPLVFIAFSGRAVGGEVRPGPEARDARFFPPDRLPPPTFPHDPEILRRWRARR